MPDRRELLAELRRAWRRADQDVHRHLWMSIRATPGRTRGSPPDAAPYREALRRRTRIIEQIGRLEAQEEAVLAQAPRTAGLDGVLPDWLLDASDGVETTRVTRWVVGRQVGFMPSAPDER